jgi:hypothetical protein
MATDGLINTYRDPRFTLISFQGVEYDVTQNVTGMQVFESINDFFLTGSLEMFDDSGMINRIPVIGQETLVFTYTKDGVDKELTFHCHGIRDLVREQKDAVSWTMKLSDPKELINSLSTFSRGYSDNAVNIIKNILMEYCDIPLEKIDVNNNDTTSSRSINIVFPFIKPYQAINRLLLDCPNAGGLSSLLCYGTVNSGNGMDTRIRGQQELWEMPPVAELGEKGFHGAGSDSTPTRSGHKSRNKIHAITVRDAYEVMGMRSKGVGGMMSWEYDITDKSAPKRILFDMEKDTPTTGRNHYFPGGIGSKDKYSVIGVHRGMNHRKIGWSNNHSSLSDHTSRNKMINNSVMGLFHGTGTLDVSCDPVEGLESGDTIYLTVQQNVPVVGSPVDPDQVSSGKYLVTGINHNFTGGEYKMSLELVRNETGVEVI